MDKQIIVEETNGHIDNDILDNENNSPNANRKVFKIITDQLTTVPSKKSKNEDRNANTPPPSPAEFEQPKNQLDDSSEY